MRPLVFFPTILILLTVSSCAKTEPLENVGIIGKWHLKEVYDGFANGGSYQWHVVSVDHSHTLSFTAANQYKKEQIVNGVNKECIGSYSLQNVTELEVNSNCNTVTERMYISELTPVSMIIDRFGREGKTSYKYQVSK